MNDFIKLRKEYSNQAYQFPLAYLEEFEISRKGTQKEKIIIDQLKSIFYLQQKNKLNEHEMNRLLSYLGENAYVNGYIAELFINNYSLFNEPEFGRRVIDLVLTDEVADSIVYVLLDSCIECHCQLFNKKILLLLLEKDTLSLDTFSMIIDYIHHFRITGFEEIFYNYLADGYPISIKIQLIDAFADLCALGKESGKSLVPKEDQPIIDNYLKTFEESDTYAIEGFTILQSMFYGDLANSGKGNNGGLAIFLKNLGKELSKSEEVARVITLAITNEWSAEQSVITEYSKGHLFLNIPIYVDKSSSTEFLKKEYFIKRTISRYLERLALKPDIYHLRFLDNASKAIARLSDEQDKKLVVTLAPDPHRNMTNQTGRLNAFSFKELIEKLNKILIGDELILASDKIVGIGSRVVKEELEHYFPQLSQKENNQKVQMISEGIQTDISLMKQEGKTTTDAELEKMGLTKQFLEKPIILNVGRLNKLKAQDQLLKAWISSGISATYNLLIVGGDLEHPSLEEKEIIDAFNVQIDKNNHLRDNFLHLGALSNYHIRKLERKIRAEQKDYPQIYLCSSKKEEFGIAILEALSQRFLVLGPIKGGVKSYLEDGKNGFLINTTNWKTIAKATEEIINSLTDKKEKFEAIQLAGEQTVEENFSMAIISEDFLSLYLSLQEKEQANEN